jgi:hypothetical protein
MYPRLLGVQQQRPIEYRKQPILDCDIAKLPLTSPKKGHATEFEMTEL